MQSKSSQGLIRAGFYSKYGGKSFGELEQKNNMSRFIF